MSETQPNTENISDFNNCSTSEVPQTLANKLLTREDFDLEMVRRERRFCHALINLWKYRNQTSFRQACVTSLIWIVFSPVGPVAASGAGLAIVIGTIVAAWSAYETRRSVEASLQTMRASVWIELWKEYSGEEMFVAMSNLRSYQTQHSKSLQNDFLDSLLDDNVSAETKQLDLYRRKVSSFVAKVGALYDAEVIDDESLKKSIGSSIKSFIEQVLYPLERAKSESLLKKGFVSQGEHDTSIRQMEDRLRMWESLK